MSTNPIISYFTRIGSVCRVGWHVCAIGLPVVLLLGLATVGQAQFSYFTSGGAATITGYNGSGGAVTIPQNYAGYPVTGISADAFDANSFALTSITSVSIPRGVTSIGTPSFMDCYSLTNIAVNVLNNNYSSLGGVLFDKSQSTLIEYPAGILGFYSIPNTVTIIGDSAFADCTKLTGITIPNGVISIGDANDVNGVFFNCTGLSTVTLPNTVASMGTEIFFSCTGLSQFAIPNSVTSLGAGAFAFCTKLNSISIGSGLTSLDDSTFSSCTSLTNIVIPNNVTSIGYEVLYGCTKLATATIGSGVTSLGASAFWGCTNLTSIYCLSNAPASVGAGVFGNDTKATIYYINGTTGWGTNFAGLPTVGLPGVPVLLNQPVSQPGILGSNATFAVAVSGIGPLSYQWYFNGYPISGATATNYSITGETVGYGGNYQVVVTNLCGGVTSSVATLEFAPVILAQPASQTIQLGSNAVFTVNPTGTAPLACQWYFNGTAISGATATNYTFTGVATNNAGNYAIVITNLYGSATSSLAVLSIYQSITFPPIQNCVLGSAPINLQATSSSGLPVSLTLGSTSPLGVPFAGNLLAPTVEGIVTVVATQTGNTIYAAANSVTNTFTVVGTNWWPILSTVSGDLCGAAFGSGQFIVVGENGIILSSTNGITWTTCNSGTTKPFEAIAYGNGLFVAAGYGILKYSADGINWNMSSIPYGITNMCEICYGNGWFYVSDGTTVYASADGLQWNTKYVLPNSYSPICFGNNTLIAASPGTGSYWNYDYLYLLSGSTWTQQQQHYYNLVISGLAYGNGAIVPVGSMGSGGGAILPSPTAGYDDVCYSGGEFIAGGFNGIMESTDGSHWISTLISNGTNDNYTYGAAFGADRCISVGCNIVYSKSGTNTFRWLSKIGDILLSFRGNVFLQQPPIISSASTASGAVGQSFNYVISANNSPTLYGASGLPAGLTVNSASGQISGNPSVGGTYSVTLTAANAGGVASKTLSLSINNGVPPVITTQPASQTVYVGGSVTFSTVASSSGSNVYQWYFNGSAIGGATGSSFAQSNVTTINAGNYSVKVSNSYGSVTSQVATLTVMLATPAIVQQPADQAQPIGNNAMFLASASGIQPLAWQWYFNNLRLAAATNAQLALGPLLTNQAGNYQLIVTNLYGSATSRVAALTVLLQPNVYGTSNGSGRMSLNLASAPGSTNRLWISTNLGLPMSQWRVIATNVASSNGLFQFTDTNTASLPKRFYRLSTP